MRPEDLEKRLEQLIQREAAVEATRRPFTSIPGDHIDADAYAQWTTSVLHALRLAFGEQSDHYQAAKRWVEDRMNLALSFDNCRGILRAAHDDFAAGLISNIRQLAIGEVFDDLVEMADHLLASKHHLSAAAITGAILEDSLRKLCATHGVTWQGHSGIGTLNTELYKAQVYAKPTHGQVEAWGKLRNAVDHHDFTEPADIDPNDVKRMVEGVRDFIAKYLT